MAQGSHGLRRLARRRARGQRARDARGHVRVQPDGVCKVVLGLRRPAAGSPALSASGAAAKRRGAPQLLREIRHLEEKSRKPLVRGEGRGVSD